MTETTCAEEASTQRNSRVWVVPADPWFRGPEVIQPDGIHGGFNRGVLAVAGELTRRIR